LTDHNAREGNKKRLAEKRACRHYNYMDNLLIIYPMLFPEIREHFEIQKWSPYDGNMPVHMQAAGS
jgi:hypothetical protein